MKRSVRDETKSCLDITIRVTLTPEEFHTLSEDQITALLKALADLNRATVPLVEGRERHWKHDKTGSYIESVDESPTTGQNDAADGTANPLRRPK